MTSHDDDEIKKNSVLRLYDDLSLTKIWNDLMHDFLSYHGHNNYTERNKKKDIKDKDKDKTILTITIGGMWIHTT